VVVMSNPKGRVSKCLSMTTPEDNFWKLLRQYNGSFFHNLLRSFNSINTMMAWQQKVSGTFNSPQHKTWDLSTSIQKVKSLNYLTKAYSKKFQVSNLIRFITLRVAHRPNLNTGLTAFNEISSHLLAFWRNYSTSI